MEPSHLSLLPLNHGHTALLLAIVLLFAIIFQYFSYLIFISLQMKSLFIEGKYGFSDQFSYWFHLPPYWRVSRWILRYQTRYFWPWSLLWRLSHFAVPLNLYKLTDKLIHSLCIAVQNKIFCSILSFNFFLFRSNDAIFILLINKG